MLETACELKALCDEFGALFVMNDHADVALVSEAHGLHVGQTDMPVEAARRVLEPHQLVGSSNGSVEEAMRSADEGVDYIAVGAIYTTTTMGKSGRRALGPEMIERVKSVVSQPGCGDRWDQRDEHRGGRGGGGRLRLRGQRHYVRGRSAGGDPEAG